MLVRSFQDAACIELHACALHVLGLLSDYTCKKNSRCMPTAGLPQMDPDVTKQLMLHVQLRKVYTDDDFMYDGSGLTWCSPAELSCMNFCECLPALLADPAYPICNFWCSDEAQVRDAD